MENKEVVKETEKKNTPLFILKIVGNVLFYAVIITLLLFSIMNINAGSKNGGFPNIFGRGFLSVQSNSMKRSGTMPEKYNEYEISEFEKGDLLLVKVFKEKDVNNLKVGDIITFYDQQLNALNSHRIVYMTKDSSNNVMSISVQGDFSVSMKGLYDPSDSSKGALNMSLQSSGDITTFDGSNYSLIKGVVTGVNSGAGKVLENIQQNWLWYFVLPVLVFLLFEVFMVVKNIMDLKGAKQKAELANDKEAMMADLEAQKEELRRQILAEMGIQQPTQQAETPKEEATTQVDEVKEEVQAEVEPEVRTEPEVTEEIKEEAATTDAVVVEETTDAEVTENVIQTLDEPSSITEVVPQEEVQAEAVEPEAQPEVVGAQEKTEEVVEPAKEEVKPTTTKKPAAKKTTTTAKKSSSSTTKKTTTSKTSTAKKASTSTAAKKSTTTKKTTTKKTTE